MVGEPTTLLEAIRFFSDPDVCVKYFAEARWPEGPICPRCEGKDHYYLASRRLWKCKNCVKQFSVKVGTIFEESPIGLDKWLPAIWMLTDDKNGISSWELHRGLGVTQKTAWFMLQRIRLAMQTGTFAKMAGQVEVDETFIGGKSRNMHKDVRERKITGTGGKDKTLVMGLLERKGHVRATVVTTRKRSELHGLVQKHVEPGAEVFTDALKSYNKLGDEYLHQFIDHAEKYVEGQVHTNGLENFWSLLKRSINGTYISVEPFHLFRYLDEQTFRYNERKHEQGDSGRFQTVVRRCSGKRLTYKEVTGKANVLPQDGN